jgi:membrane protease YdiL (CAAX protease family)
MNTSEAPARAKRRGFGVHWRGHVLLFDKLPESRFGGSSGTRLLLIAVGLEALRLPVFAWLRPTAPLWSVVPVLLACALLMVRVVAGMRLSQIGLYPWRDWNAIEKSYFIQLLVLANTVFPLVFAARLRGITGQPSALSTLLTVFVPYLFFGFYQEVVYRGMLQSELVRRFGPVVGIVVANALYTFGPLHWYYFSSKSSVAVPMFAAIFAIGLFFGLLFRRSGNLWIVAVIHAIGNAYIVTSLAK